MRTERSLAEKPRIRPPAVHGMPALLTRRLTGPGGLYNLGNLIGLVSGLYLSILKAADLGTGDTASGAALGFLAGSGGNLALSSAMLIFFWSGEVYGAAWRADPGTAEGRRLLARADFLSGLGALCLALALALFGDVALAATSTILLAGGKFGSALSRGGRFPVRIEYPSGRGYRRHFTFDPFRAAVVASRVPAVLGLVIGAIEAVDGRNGLAFTEALILLVCYLIWTRADLLLISR